MLKLSRVYGTHGEGVAVKNIQDAYMRYYEAYRDIVTLTHHQPTDPDVLALASLAIHTGTLSIGKACEVFGLRRAEFRDEILSADDALRIVQDRLRDNAE